MLGNGATGADADRIWNAIRLRLDEPSRGGRSRRLVAAVLTGLLVLLLVVFWTRWLGRSAPPDFGGSSRRGHGTGVHVAGKPCRDDAAKLRSQHRRAAVFGNDGTEQTGRRDPDTADRPSSREQTERKYYEPETEPS